MLLKGKNVMYTLKEKACINRRTNTSCKYIYIVIYTYTFNHFRYPQKYENGLTSGHQKFNNAESLNIYIRH